MTASTRTTTHRIRIVLSALAGALALMCALAGLGVAAPAPVVVIDTAAQINPALTPGVALAGGRAGHDPASHGSLMLTTIAGPGAPALGARVGHYGCEDQGGMIDGVCAIHAMEAAITSDARVISLSWSLDMASVPEGYRARFAQLVAAARARGQVVVAAAYPGGPTFPADIPGVISVGSAHVDGQIAYPGDNARVRLPVEASAGLDMLARPIVRGGSSFATAEFAARAAALLGVEPGVDEEQLMARVAVQMRRDAPGMPSGGPPAARSGPDADRAIRVHARPRTVPVPSARQLRAAVRLRAHWSRSGLVLAGNRPRGAQVDVVWRSTRFACERQRCVVPLIGARTSHVRVRVSHRGRTVVLRVAARR